MTTLQPKAVAVYCAATFGKQPAYRSAATSLGTAIAKAKLSLVYGGGTYGLMGLVSDAVLEGGCSVTGIIPRSISISGSEGTPKEDSYANANKRPTLKEKRSTFGSLFSNVFRTGPPGAKPRIAEPEFKAPAVQDGVPRMERIIVNSMTERKSEMAKRVDGFFGLPGGFGTIDEIVDVITWTQRNLYSKPIFLINVLSYYEPLRQIIRNGIEENFIPEINESYVIFNDGPEAHGEHEAFDWGAAAISAFEAWEEP
ncbi:hypothetical protein B0H16DRAFT_1481329 [Mycena metata]|uniref:Lysine decarboxylase n=1 Tax=Mycena metata TaxID=1033252 RepID=A0AAD7GYZ7_9AGAR|nr:hypothetical protein B0H16DRAFT_1481329 [Mycena metata]